MDLPGRPSSRPTNKSLLFLHDAVYSFAKIRTGPVQYLWRDRPGIISLSVLSQPAQRSLALLGMRISRGQTAADRGQQGDRVTSCETLRYPFQTGATLEWLQPCVRVCDCVCVAAVSVNTPCRLQQRIKNNKVSISCRVFLL